MPGLQFIKILGNLKFFSHGLKLPVSWQAPSGDPGGKQYGDSLKPSEKVAAPQLIPPWFMPAEPQKYFQDSCDKIGKEFKSFHDDILDAVGFAHNMWKLQAKFQNLQIMAVSAIGEKGKLLGAGLIGHPALGAAAAQQPLAHEPRDLRGLSRLLVRRQRRSELDR